MRASCGPANTEGGGDSMPVAFAACGSGWGAGSGAGRAAQAVKANPAAMAAPSMAVLNIIISSPPAGSDPTPESDG